MVGQEQKCENISQFGNILDGPTDGRMDGQTDTAACVSTTKKKKKSNEEKEDEKKHEQIE